MGDGGFEFDIAFTFLQQDEALALRLADLLRDRFKVFVYSEQQKEIAGKNAEIKFNEVFGKTARLVIVLYRKGWGDSGFTLVEQTAIQNRAFGKPYDFVLVIPVESGQGAPDWFPKNRIWVNLQRWGIEAAASIIEERAKEIGSTPVVETAVEYAARLTKEAAQTRKLKELYESHEGVQIAKGEMKALCDKIAAMASDITKGPDGYRLETVSELDGYGFRVKLQNSTLTMSLSLNTIASNTLKDSSLDVGIDITRIRDAKWQTEELLHGRYTISFNPDRSVSWQEDGGSRRRQTSTSLADLLIKEFVRSIIETRPK